MIWNNEVILTEGAIVERVRRTYKVELDKDIVSAALIYHKQGRKILGDIYREYIDIAASRQLPIIVMTSTRRANKERIARSNYADKDVIGDYVNFLKGIRDTYSTHKGQIYIGGLIGCKGDAYDGENALGEEEAKHYHSWQVEAFKKAGVDFLFGCIMPALTETIGLSKAMEDSGLPYILSFMIRKDGKLLDGTFINDAIVAIDHATSNKAEGYMVNCVHPLVLKQALETEENKTEIVRKRFIGIQANTSSLSPEELDACEVLREESMEELVEVMMDLRKKYGLRIQGGCCGTTGAHISLLAKRLVEEKVK